MNSTDTIKLILHYTKKHTNADDALVNITLGNYGNRWQDGEFILDIYWKRRAAKNNKHKSYAFDTSEEEYQRVRSELELERDLAYAAHELGIDLGDDDVSEAYKPMDHATHLSLIQKAEENARDARIIRNGPIDDEIVIPECGTTGIDIPDNITPDWLHAIKHGLALIQNAKACNWVALENSQQQTTKLKAQLAKF